MASLNPVHCYKLLLHVVISIKFLPIISENITNNN